MPKRGSYVAELKEKVTQLTLRAACQREFVLVESLKKWLCESNEDGTGPTRVISILEEVFGKEEAQYESTEGMKKHLLLLVLLIQLEQPRLLRIFRRKNITDRSLFQATLSAVEVNKHISSGNISDSQKEKNAAFAEEFDRERWRFCPMVFETTADEQEADERIVPIIEKEQISKGSGFSTIWAVTMPKEFIAEAIAEEIQHSEFQHGDVVCYSLVFKTFGAESRDRFKKERRSYNVFSTGKGMISYLGSFSDPEEPRKMPFREQRSPSVENGLHAPATSSTSEKRYQYSLILEYGDADLDQWFSQNHSLVEAEERVTVWSKFFQLLLTVHRFHNIEYIRDGEVKKFYGWHADIKPDNILIAGPQHSWQFKLTDPGFARHQLSDDAEAESEPIITLEGGTLAFSPPERRGNQAISRGVDIWALGCVFSLAATWMLFGSSGYHGFRNIREAAVFEIWRENNGQAIDVSKLKDERQVPNSREAFHDGEELLGAVKDWHKYLRAHIPPADKITGQVLKIVEDHMLQKKENRLTAKELFDKFSATLVEGQKAAVEGITPRLARLTGYNDHATADTPSGSALHEGGNARSGLIKPSAAKFYPQPSSQVGLRKSRLISSLMAPKSSSDPVEDGRTSPHQERSGYAPAGVPNLLLDTKFRMPTVIDPFMPLIREESSPSSDPYALNASPTEITPKSSHSEMLKSQPLPETSGKPRSPPSLHGQTHSKSDRRSFMTPKEEMPYKTVELIRQERESRELKSGRFSYKGLSDRIRNRAEESDQILKGQFDDRDIRILIDDGNSMEEHWHLVQLVAYEIAAKAVNLDKDGFDFHITSSSKVHEKRRLNDLNRFKRNLEDYRPTKDSGPTNMAHALDQCFKARERAQAKQKPTRLDPSPKMEVLYVLTDGVWGLNNPRLKGAEEVGKVIASFWERQKELENRLRGRPFSIQFIQVGDHEIGSQRLRWLDKRLKEFGCADDIVDTTHATDNFYKMMLGSFTPRLDCDSDLDSPSDKNEGGDSRYQSGYESSPRHSTPDVNARKSYLSNDSRATQLQSPTGRRFTTDSTRSPSVMSGHQEHAFDFRVVPPSRANTAKDDPFARKSQ